MQPHEQHIEPAAQATRDAPAAVGTDSVWSGPPQTQIMAFRAFAISAEYQDWHGHPELTDAVKAAGTRPQCGRAFGLDAQATRCALAADTLSASRPVQRELAAAGDLPAPWVPRGPVSRGRCCDGSRTRKAGGYPPEVLGRATSRARNAVGSGAAGSGKLGVMQPLLT
jgi:hypothetical protein